VPAAVDEEVEGQQTLRVDGGDWKQLDEVGGSGAEGCHRAWLRRMFVALGAWFSTQLGHGMVTAAAKVPHLGLDRT
jgi:hypothetical protein